MDRTIYDTRIAWGSYSENSGSTPNFHERKRRNELLPVHSYHWHRVDGKSPLGATLEGPRTERELAGWYNGISDTLRNGYLHTGHGIQPYLSMRTLDSYHSILRNRLATKLIDTPINLGVAMGEYRSTASLLTGAMQSTRQLLRATRGLKYSDAVDWLLRDRGRTVSNADVARSAADAWLGFTYGVMPLIRDVLGAVELLTRPERKPRVKVTTRLSEPIRGITFVTVGQHTTTIEVDGSLSGTAEMLFDIENPFAFDLYQTGVTNPLGVAWELIPYSFVVDWFIPIGNLMNTVIPPQGVSFVRGWTYVKAKGMTKRYTRTVPNGWYTWDTSGSSTETLKDRRVLASFPRYELDIPDLSLSKSQITSGIALLVQQLTSSNSGEPIRRR